MDIKHYKIVAVISRAGVTDSQLAWMHRKFKEITEALPEVYISLEIPGFPGVPSQPWGVPGRLLNKPWPARVKVLATDPGRNHGFHADCDRILLGCCGDADEIWCLPASLQMVKRGAHRPGVICTRGQAGGRPHAFKWIPVWVDANPAPKDTEHKPKKNKGVVPGKKQRKGAKLW